MGLRVGGGLEEEPALGGGFLVGAAGGFHDFRFFLCHFVEVFVFGGEADNGHGATAQKSALFNDVLRLEEHVDTVFVE